MLARRNTRVRKNRTAVAALATLVAALLALAVVPAFASAANYIVDSNADSVNGSPGTNCDPAAPASEECTLRAAIELADAKAEPATIDLSHATFDGTGSSSEIILNEPLPAIEHQTKIFSSIPCSDGSSVKPCAGLIVPALAIGFQVEGDGVTIEDVAISGAGTGIQVRGKEFSVHGVWFGMNVSGTPKPIEQVGVLVGPGGDDATIGSGDPAQPRNVFTNSAYGVLVTAASGAKIQGNYIGVRPDGSTLAGVAVPVSIVNLEGGGLAKENEVGGVLTPQEAQTPACDGPCNVIASSAGIGIDLTGESALVTEAPAGPTTIRGNYVGLDASGTEAIEFGASNPEYGILATPSEGGHPGAMKVTIGGTAPTETNYFEGGEETIFAEGAEGIRIAGNRIGVAADNSVSESPTNVAIHVVNSIIVNRTPKITGNQLVLSPDPTGIEVLDGNTEIVGNTIQGSFAGIKTTETSGFGTGNLIEGNTINETDVIGIELEDDSNMVIGNSITNGGKFGILVAPSAEGNRIGGDGPGEANTLIANGYVPEEAGERPEGGAIVVVGQGTSRNEVAANLGYGNQLAFIQLLGLSGSEFPNDIVPPTISGAYPTSAIGTAEPGATVRVFVKASTDPGELGAYLGKVKADATTGQWSVPYSTSVPLGTLVAATQTSNAGLPSAGTSEVSAPVDVVVSPAEEREQREIREEKEAAERQEKAAQEQREKEAAERSSAKPAPTPAPVPSGPVAKVAPKVKITAGPKKTSAATAAQFKFKATNVPSAKFECKLDGAKWASCKSPKGYKKLKPGKHTFRVRAKANGITGGTLKYQFTITS